MMTDRQGKSNIAMTMIVAGVNSLRELGNARDVFTLSKRAVGSRWRVGTAPREWGPLSHGGATARKIRLARGAELTRRERGGPLREADRAVRYAHELERCHSLRITARDFATDQAGPHLEVVHGLDYEREAIRPVIATPGD